MASTLIELAGIACLVVAGVHIHPALGWAAAGLCLIAKAFELEVKRGPGRRSRSLVAALAGALSDYAGAGADRR